MWQGRIELKSFSDGRSHMYQPETLFACFFEPHKSKTDSNLGSFFLIHGYGSSKPT